MFYIRSLSPAPVPGLFARPVSTVHEAANTVEIALRADKRIVDKITKGAKMHG